MTMNTSPIVPAQTALMLMDLQPAILASLGETEQLLAHAHAALEWARSEKVRVVYVRVAFTPQDCVTIPTHNPAFAAVAVNKLLADGAPESAIHGSFEIREGDIVVRKTS
jgi:nicotinamidase-related amidase